MVQTAKDTSTTAQTKDTSTTAAEVDTNEDLKLSDNNLSPSDRLQAFTPASQMSQIEDLFATPLLTPDPNSKMEDGFEIPIVRGLAALERTSVVPLDESKNAVQSGIISDGFKALSEAHSKEELLDTYKTMVKLEAQLFVQATQDLSMSFSEHAFFNLEQRFISATAQEVSDVTNQKEMFKHLRTYLDADSENQVKNARTFLIENSNDLNLPTELLIVLKLDPENKSAPVYEALKDVVNRSVDEKINKANDPREAIYSQITKSIAAHGYDLALMQKLSGNYSLKELMSSYDQLASNKIILSPEEAHLVNDSLRMSNERSLRQIRFTSNQITNSYNEAHTLEDLKRLHDSYLRDKRKSFNSLQLAYTNNMSGSKEDLNTYRSVFSALKDIYLTRPDQEKIDDEITKRQAQLNALEVRVNRLDPGLATAIATGQFTSIAEQMKTRLEDKFTDNLQAIKDGNSFDILVKELRRLDMISKTDHQLAPNSMFESENLGQLSSTLQKKLHEQTMGLLATGKPEALSKAISLTESYEPSLASKLKNLQLQQNTLELMTGNGNAQTAQALVNDLSKRGLVPEGAVLPVPEIINTSVEHVVNNPSEDIFRALGGNRGVINIVNNETKKFNLQKQLVKLEAMVNYVRELEPKELNKEVAQDVVNRFAEVYGGLSTFEAEKLNMAFADSHDGFTPMTLTGGMTRTLGSSTAEITSALSRGFEPYEYADIIARHKDYSGLAEVVKSKVTRDIGAEFAIDQMVGATNGDQRVELLNALDTQLKAREESDWFSPPETAEIWIKDSLDKFPATEPGFVGKTINDTLGDQALNAEQKGEQIISIIKSAKDYKDREYLLIQDDPSLTNRLKLKLEESDFLEINSIFQSSLARQTSK